MKAALAIFVVCSLVAPESYWVYVETNSAPHKRHECGAAAIDNRLYVIGGRGMKPVDVYDAVNNRWDTVAGPPIELNHFQAASYKGEIYIAGAFTGNYPHELPVENIYILNPKTGWRKGPKIPEDRLRGAAAFVQHKGKLYAVGGITDGHWDGHVTWFDEYDPISHKWSKLPDAPHARDHISAAVVDNKLYIIGGRKSTARIGKVLELLVPEVDVYDFAKGSWTTLPEQSNLPTLRAGNSLVVKDKTILVIGGESNSRVRAHADCEAFDTKTGTWTALDTLNTGRHGTQAVMMRRGIYLAAGSANRGGGPEQDSMELFK